MADKVHISREPPGPASARAVLGRSSRGANLLMLVVAVGAVFVTFLFTTLIHEPASIATLAGILVLSVALDYGWKHFRDTRTKNVQLAH